MISSVEPLVGITDVARLLGVSRQRAYQLSQREDWPKGQQVASIWVWSEAEIEAWIEQRDRKRT